jgi:hypothetical protein
MEVKSIQKKGTKWLTCNLRSQKHTIEKFKSLYCLFTVQYIAFSKCQKFFSFFFVVLIELLYLIRLYLHFTILFVEYICLICLICCIIFKAIKQFGNFMFHHVITLGLLIVVHLTIQKENVCAQNYINKTFFFYNENFAIRRCYCLQVPINKHSKNEIN